MGRPLVVEIDARDVSDRLTPCPAQVFRDADERLWMFVHEERREGVDGWLWVGVKDRNVCTRWTAADVEPIGELVNDTDGRKEAVAMFLAAKGAAQEADKLKRERDALVLTLKDAIRRLPPAQGEELRRMYRRGLTASSAH